MNIIEVEMRGPLSRQQFRKLKAFFNKKATFKEKRERIIIDYSTFLKKEKIRKRNFDIRARITNGIPELIIKVGKWKGSDARKEFSILLQKGQFPNLIKILAVLGYKKGMLCFRKSLVYKYKDIEFALVEVPKHSYYFEAEIIVSLKRQIKNAQAKIKTVCTSLGLKPFSDKEFFNYLKLLNREANKIYNFDKMKNKGKLYFKNLI